MTNEENENVIEFKSKSQKRRILKELDADIEKAKVSDEDFAVFMEALLGPYKGGGYNPE